MSSYVAGSLVGNGQTATVSSLGAVIPASAAVGDVAIVALEVFTDVGSWTTPAGWTKLASHYRSSTPSNSVVMFGKTLAAGEPGSTVTFTNSGTRRMVGTVSVFRGVTLTGFKYAVVGEGYSTTTTLPTLASVPAGAMVVGFYGRENASTSPAPPSFTSTPAGYTAGGESKSAYGSPTDVVSRVVYKSVAAAGTYGGATATTNVSTGGLNYLLALPTTDATVYGVTATVTASAKVIDGGIPTGPVSVSGATAIVIAQGSVAPVPPPAPAPAAWPPDPYRQAIRGTVAIWYTVDALLGGVPVVGATDLAPTGGTITDTSRPGVRRVLSLELAPEPGLFNLLAPVGTELRVTAHVRYTSRDVLDIPMGVFVVDSETLSEGGGGLSLTAPDKWSLIQRAKFIRPRASNSNMRVVDQIAALIREALGNITVNIYATSPALVGAMTWEKDRDKAILDLARAASAWVFFDRDGVATVADLPTAGAAANWLVDSSASGVLTSLSRERSRTDTCNVVVVESSAADGASFPTQVVWDSDPSSPTYAGPDPLGNPGAAGPFGVVPYFYDTPLPLDANGARNAGLTILARVMGLASQVSLGQIPNPALSAFDAIDVLPPRERYDQPRVLERHVVDTVTYPLTVEGEQHIEGRSTRAEEV